MQYYQSSGDFFKRNFLTSPQLVNLVAINVIVWFLLGIIQLAGFLTSPAGSGGDSFLLEQIVSWLGIPAFVPSLLSKPWTLLSYMFVHEGFMHIFFNMIWLFWFGKILLQFLPGNRIYYLYVLGGLSGALFFVVAYNIFPVFQSSLPQAITIGASASVLAIIVATAVLVPDYAVNLLFIGQIKIKYIALITIILDILMIRSGNAGGHFAHLGGAFFGFVFIIFTRKDVARRLGLLSLSKYFENIITRKKLRTVHTSAGPLTDEQYNQQRADNQKRIDEILDKISRSGYATLSSEEKDILFKFSKK
jgi:membrane associated rhomboid family serine protease